MSTLKKNSVTPSTISVKSVVVPINVSNVATGTYSTGIGIPAGSHIIRAYLEKISAFTGTGATIALSLVNAGDILASTVATGLSSTINSCIPSGASVNIVKNTGATALNITYTVATAAITAGNYNLYVEYK